MLKHLEINNYAIIDELKLDFHEGMTVLTGETGAGKSIIVDAISLLLGDRASKEMISSKADMATVTGIFSMDSDNLKTVMKQNSIDYDETISITRSVSKDNRNTVKINGQISSIKVLKDLAVYLADIHSQFDTNRLINPENYLALVDNFRKDRIIGFLSDYKVLHDDYLEAVNKYNLLQKEKENTLKQLDLYKFQFNELDSLALVSGEEEEMTDQVSLLENMDKINSVLERFTGMIEEGRVLETLYVMKNDLDSISKTTQDFLELSNRLNDVYYELDDINQTLNDRHARLDYDQRDYDRMINRLTTLEKVRNKYRKSLEELIEYKDFLDNEINKADNYDEIIADQGNVVKEKQKVLLSQALQLREFRKELAKKITKELKETLKDLVIINADFEIRFEDRLPKNEFDIAAFSEDGIDTIDFYISTNLGEPLKQLSKTASGGEMSRVMLAFKSIFVRNNNLSTIIFDEIDTGISGYIAKQIANKIQEISKISQVISITHIPQVVATGQHHISVRKSIVGKGTKISVQYLNYQERVEEIARMISADKVTNASIESAKELLVSK